MKIFEKDYKIVGGVPVFPNTFIKFPLGDNEVDEYANLTYSDFFRIAQSAREEAQRFNREYTDRVLTKINLMDKNLQKSK